MCFKNGRQLGCVSANSFVYMNDGNTCRTRARLVLLFISTTPRTVSPNRYAAFVKVSTATLTPSLFTSYDAKTGVNQSPWRGALARPTFLRIPRQDLHRLSAPRQPALLLSLPLPLEPPRIVILPRPAQRIHVLRHRRHRLSRQLNPDPARPGLRERRKQPACIILQILEGALDRRR